VDFIAAIAANAVVKQTLRTTNNNQSAVQALELEPA